MLAATAAMAGAVAVIAFSVAHCLGVSATTITRSPSLVAKSRPKAP